MREKPSWVLAFERPVGTKIKFIHGHWYLYEWHGVYDKVTGKKKKKGRILGAITEKGFIPSRNRMAATTSVMGKVEEQPDLFLEEHTTGSRENSLWKSAPSE